MVSYRCLTISTLEAKWLGLSGAIFRATPAARINVAGQSTIASCWLLNQITSRRWSALVTSNRRRAIHQFAKFLHMQRDTIRLIKDKMMLSIQPFD